MFGGRVYATYNPEKPRLATKHIALPEAFKKLDVNNYFVAVETEKEDIAALTVHFVEKFTGAFNVYFRNNDGTDWGVNSAVWFNYIVVIGHLS